MKKLILKCGFYFLITLVILEVLVRVFHLAKDNPSRYLDEHNVEKWKPNQSGYSVTGNRNQNFSEFKINNSGFNSYREFTPSKSNFELALVGDSFFQGFHQDYHNSIGKKIENKIPKIEVYEYGYAGYDYADQIHLINQYKKTFELIDKVVIYINFEDDLTRDNYKVLQERLKLEKGMSGKFRKSKLLVYTKGIGIFKPITDFIQKAFTIGKTSKPKKIKKPKILQQEKETRHNKYVENFEKLNSTYGFNRNKFTLLLDSKKTPTLFLNYLKKNNYNFIDYRPKFETTNKNKTLIYDKHWNDLGREFVAQAIFEYMNQSNLL